MVFDGRCSNKNCSLRAAVKPTPAKRSSAKVKAAGKNLDVTKPPAKVPSTRRASKCITYNLYEDQEKEPEN